MEVNCKFIDYYKILETERSATGEELKKNYQRLVLASHPDKNVEKEASDFLLIQKAWSILRNPESRKQYNAMLACYENSDVLLYNTILLSEMDHDSESDVYTYSCRCSGLYCLEEYQVNFPSVIINCNECSFSIQVDIPQKE